MHFPDRYKTTVTLHRCWWVVAACWLMAATVGFTPLMGWNNHTSMSQSNRSECQFLNVMSMSFLVYFSLYTCFLLPMLIMTIVYCCIFILIQRQLRSSSTVVSHSYYHKERNLARSLVLVLVLFAVCWLPIQLMNMATFYGTKFTVPRPALYVGILLSQANSAINPVLYALKIQHIQAASKKIWRRFFRCKDEPQSSQTSGSDNSSNPRKTRDENYTKSVETTEQGL